MDARKLESSFDVYLFWMVTLCGLLSAFVPVVVKMVLQVISRESELESNLRRQACDLKAELGSVSMVDEFAKYAKIKRKVNKVTTELSHQADMKSSFALKVRLIASAAFYGLISCTVAFLMWNYRKVPVAVIPEDWLFPFGWILSYPSGISAIEVYSVEICMFLVGTLYHSEEGAISPVSWLFICSTVGRVMASSVKY